MYSLHCRVHYCHSAVQCSAVQCSAVNNTSVHTRGVSVWQFSDEGSRESDTLADVDCAWVERGVTWEARNLLC